MRFTHDTSAQRVILESGRAAAHVQEELDRLGAASVMIIGGRRHDRLIDALDRAERLRWTDVVQHVPVSLAERARAAAAQAHVDVVVAVGGGSAIGLAKAVAHCVDALWAPRADPINAGLAGEGLRELNRGLRELADDPTDLLARERMQYACYLAAVAFASAGSAMHHKICHALGGTFDLPHAATHAIVLPYVLAWNAAAAPDASRRFAVAYEATDPVLGLEQLRTYLDAPRALRDVGLAKSDLARAAGLALATIPSSNPRPVDEAALTRLLHAAWAGDPPDTVRSDTLDTVDTVDTDTDTVDTDVARVGALSSGPG